MLPSEEKVSGKDIQDYAILLKENSSEVYKKKFATFLKNGADPTEIISIFEKVKKSILA